MRAFTTVAALSAFTLVSALNGTEFTIDPTEITLTERATWCQGQESTCTTLCDSNPILNSCDDSTLDWSCTCQNGSVPGLQYYTQTIDTYVCNQAYSDCIDTYVGNQAGQSNCTTSIMDVCGTLDPNDYSSSSSASTSASASDTASATTAASTGTASASATSSTAAAAAATNFHQVGTGAAAAAFGLLAYML